MSDSDTPRKTVIKLKKYLKSIKRNKADQYIQFCIIMGIVLAMTAGFFSIYGVFSQKMWLNDKMTDISRKISVCGCYKDTDVKAMEKEVTDRLGGSFTYTGDILDTSAGTVQLGSVIHINYKTEVTVFSIGTMNFTTNIDISKDSISEVYIK